ncbi:hypothetical protein QR680_006024 [Steinernema hermaphroditum]|uniref:C-type lectin domain-containing protein n=1 Tax=Steinernema hermaphroditum TaxID=289476 RepID=A0AA39HW85_9BILA|nr:hypothetical protein QR680_006024 [Steinernema hermaphroditum]
MIPKLFVLVAFSALFAIGDSKCAEGWLEFSNNCYFVNAERLNWTSAEAFCVARNAHLTSIHNFEENAFVSSLAADAQPRLWLNWIGGFSKNNDKIYAWSDGSNWDFALWSPVQPYPYPCVAFLINPPYMSWASANCDASTSSICKKPSV